MSLFVYTRHPVDCPKKSDRFWKRCRCPKWIRGTLEGSPVRQSADTRSWERAEEKRKSLESEAEKRQLNLATNENPKVTEPISVEFAVDRFLASKRNENLTDSTLDKLEMIFRKRFLSWTKIAGLKYIVEISSAHLEEFRDTWKDGPLSKKKK